MIKIPYLVMAFLLPVIVFAMEDSQYKATTINSDDTIGIVSLKNEIYGMPTKESGAGTGTIISSNLSCGESKYVLTNAHCIRKVLGIESFSGLNLKDKYEYDYPYSNDKPKRLFVLNHTYTENFMFGREDCIDEIAVKKIILHPDCNNLTTCIDLAILVLEKEVENKKPFFIDGSLVQLKQDQTYCVDGFGTTGDLSTYPFKLISTTTPRRKNIYCQDTYFTGATGYGNNYTDTNLYYSYFIHEKWLFDPSVENKIIESFNNLKPSKNFVYKGDSGGPMYDPITNQLIAISTFGGVIKANDESGTSLHSTGLEQVFFNYKEMKIEVDCDFDNSKHMDIPRTFYTPISGAISKWILDTIGGY